MAGRNLAGPQRALRAEDRSPLLAPLLRSKSDPGDVMNRNPWSVYIIKCRDDKLYTGISNDVPNRVRAHNEGNGCKFTKCRFPVRLVYTEECGTRSVALKKEIWIQKLGRSKKLELIDAKAGYQ